MQAFIRGQSPEYVSTAVMGSVLECHDQSCDFLRGMAPDTIGEPAHVYTDIGSGPEPQTLAPTAVRHLGALMARDRGERMRYLSDAGMGDAETASLIALVTGWVDQADLERLGELSQFAVQGELGPGHLLERWITGRCKLQLAMLLAAPDIQDSHLAAAYAVAHAAELVLASYWSAGVPDNGVVAWVPGDDLD